MVVMIHEIFSFKVKKNTNYTEIEITRINSVKIRIESFNILY